ncbi:neurite extension and migration factor [Electrophorus electricus]|uniref:neurite extension and migration factor n=1 Tax=Electrophorus electricus TaxID=8005 RepID=UPI0015CF8770|nr:neurite extension and migration factor [Electrophorus electricus]
MDVPKETSLIVQALNSAQTSALDQTGLHELRSNLRLYGTPDAALAPLSSIAALSAQRGDSDCQRVALTLREYQFSGPPSPETLTEARKQPADEFCGHGISLTSCVTKDVSRWALGEDSTKPPFTMMESMGVSGLTEDCLIQQSRSCLGCGVETKDTSDAEPSVSLKMADINQEYDACSLSDISMQCMSTSETGNYGEQLLSDQLLSFPMPKSQLEGKKDMEKIENEPNQTSKNMHEGLLLDKCNGEESLLTTSNQDWGYFESFISESKMELLDLCSKNELSVNLFSEEDVDNYMFDDDDDDSTLSSDMCSLKIRYESFQDNMREKTNVLQEEAQFNFFPSVLVNCTKKETNVVRRSVDGLLPKPEELGLEHESKGDDNDSSLDRTPDYSPKMNYFIDSSNSAEDSGEYSDDSSCTGYSIDTFHEGKHRNSFSLKNVCSSPLNYGLRAKRKVRYSDDYLYDVDSIESEKNNEKREKLSCGPKEEEDDDWCPKKRRKSSRKEPPVIIKYIIINKFKGEKRMCVKLSKTDPAVTTVSLTEDLISEYQKLAPLKDFWQEKHREQEEQLRQAAGDKHNFHLNGRHRPFSSSPPKRKHKLANRLRIQRIQTVEQSPQKQGFSPSDPRVDVGTKDETAPTARPLTMAASSCASALDANDIIHTVTPKSRSQEREERRMGNKMVRIRKFKSEARLKCKKMRDLEESGESMTNPADACAVLENKDMVGGGNETEIDSAVHSPQLCESQTPEDTEKFAFMSATCSPNNATSSQDVATSVPVIPGGYLQTLLDASDSSGSSGVPFFPQQTPRQHSLGLSLEDQQFASLQLAQSCVLSPPSESELQQSPQNCPNLTQMWHSQLGPNQQFTSNIPETAILPNNFSNAMPVPMSENLAVPGYSQLGLEGNRMLYEKNYMPEQALPPDAEFQVCQVPCVEGQLQFQRGTLHTDNGRLISFDSVGSLSATSSNYSSLSLKSCEKDGEDDVNENFLAHCSPKLVIQQSIDAITPLRESTDLLDISNFTPDKFRHTSLSELSPPETPNLSPQVIGREMKMVGKAKVLSNGSEMPLEDNQEMKWNCTMIEQQNHLTGFTGDSHHYQLHSFNQDDCLCLKKEGVNQADFYEQAADMIGGIKGAKSKRKNSSKQSAGQVTKKSKTPRAAKGEKVKSPRQNSRASKKLKALLDEKSGKSQLGGSKYMSHQLTDNSSDDWPGMGWPEKNSQADDQREFEEPSNILSNIVSGMAEVQRFMMASIEPIWGPAVDICLPSEANSLKLKTLKILAGTSSDPKKKGAVSVGGTKGRKAGGKGSKNQAKLNASHPLFPQLTLGCNMFDKPNLGVPGINGPAHKKMYRHKTSAKFPRIENLKGKRAERDPSKDIALMTSFEKLR